MFYQSIFGNITPPSSYQSLNDPSADLGLIGLVNNLIGILTALAGIFVIINFIAAGYLYLSANGEAQKITNAGNKILQSIIGLAIVAVAYVIAAILGQILFNNPTAFLKLSLFSPQ